MKYFQSFPLVSVSLPNGSTKVYRNILTRLSVIPSILTNPVLFYEYDIQEGDTPEIVADKYYGDSYRYWIVLFCNQLMDPQWDWPLSGANLQNYIVDKYTNLGFDPMTTVKSYQKTITKINLTNNLTTTEVVEISEFDYNNSIPFNGTFSLPGETVQVSINYSVQTYYDYEVSLNDSKRTIKLLDTNYVQDIEDQFITLLKQ